MGVKRKAVAVAFAAAIAVAVLPGSSAAAVPNVSGRLYHYSTAPGPCTLKTPALYAIGPISVSRSYNSPWFISQSLAWSTVGPGQIGTKAYNVYHYSVDKRYGGCERVGLSILRTQYWFATSPRTDCYRMVYSFGVLISTGWGTGRC